MSAIIANILGPLGGFLAVAFVVLLVLLVVVFVKCWRKAEQGKALIRTGVGTKVSFTGLAVIPIAHRLEMMDISVKRIEIFRHGKDGLICKDNMRATSNWPSLSG